MAFPCKFNRAHGLRPQDYSTFRKEILLGQRTQKAFTTMSYVQRIRSLIWNCILQTNSRLWRSLNIKIDDKKRYVRSFTRNLQDNNVIEWEGAMDHALGGGSRGEGEEIVWDPSTGALPWRIDRLARRGVVSGISCALFLSLHTLYISCMWTDWQEIE